MEIHKGTAGRRDVGYHPFQRKLVEQLVQFRYRGVAVPGELLLVDGHRIRKDAGVAAHQGLQQRNHLRIWQLSLVQGVAGRVDAHSRGEFSVFSVADVAGLLEVAQGIVDLRNLQFVLLAEGFRIEVEGTALAGLVDDFVEYVELLVDVFDEFERGEGGIQHLAQVGQVGGVPEKHRIGALAVAACPSRLLEIGFQAVGWLPVHHEAHVGLVDAHAEGVGAHHHPYLATLPGLLPFAAAQGPQAGMVVGSADALAFKQFRHFFAALAVAQVHDSRSGHTPADVQQLARLVLALAHYVGQVGTLETGAQHLERGTLRVGGQAYRDVAGHFRRRGGGECDHGSIHALPQLAYVQVVGAEVVAPLGDTVRLVHHQETDLKHVQVGSEKRRAEALGRHVEELAVAVGGVVQGRIHFAARHSGVHRYGLDAPLLQVLHLVLHQGDQGGHDQGQAVPHHRRHLEADGLAAAGGKYGESVTSLQRGSDDFLLHRTEGVVAPPALQNLLGSHARTMNTQGRLPMVTGSRRHAATVRVRMKAVGRVRSAATVRRVEGWRNCSRSFRRESLR